MNRIMLGVIGIGNMGTEHVKSILRGATPEIELAAVADLREDRRAWAKAHLPETVAVFDSGDALIASGVCSAVLIVTPHPHHPLLTIAALEHGLDVLCEKPIAIDVKNARRMADAAKKSGRTFALMFNQRTNCLYRGLKQLLDDGEMGAVKRISWTITDWYRTQRYYDSGNWRGTWKGEGGGILLNQCPHQLDLLQWLFGMPARLRAFCHEGKWHDIEVEDDVTAYMEFPGGATGTFVASTGDLPGVNRLEVMLEYGRIVCENDQLRVWKLPMSERAYCRTTDDVYAGLAIQESIIETDGQNPQHVGVMNAFAAHILHGAPLVACGAEGINALLLSNAMHLSAWTDSPVDLRAMDEERFLAMLEDRKRTSRLKDKQDITFETDHTAGGRTLR